MVMWADTKTERRRLLDVDVLPHFSYRSFRCYFFESGEERSHRETELQCCPGDLHELPGPELNWHLKLRMSRHFGKLFLDHWYDHDGTMHLCCHRICARRPPYVHQVRKSKLVRLILGVSQC